MPLMSVTLTNLQNTTGMRKLSATRQIKTFDMFSCFDGFTSVIDRQMDKMSQQYTALAQHHAVKLITNQPQYL